MISLTPALSPTCQNISCSLTNRGLAIILVSCLDLFFASSNIEVNDVDARSQIDDVVAATSLSERKAVFSSISDIRKISLDGKSS